MNRRELREIGQALALLSHLGLTVVVAVLLGGALGVALQWIGLGKLGLLLGILAGVGGAGVGAWGLVAKQIDPLPPAPAPPKQLEEDRWPSDPPGESSPRS